MPTSNEPQTHRPRNTRTNWVLIGFLAIVGYFLFMEHRAHILEFLPWLLLLACPLMHIFMHRGHGGGHKH